MSLRFLYFCIPQSNAPLPLSPNVKETPQDNGWSVYGLSDGLVGSSTLCQRGFSVGWRVQLKNRPCSTVSPPTSHSSRPSRHSDVTETPKRFTPLLMAELHVYKECVQDGANVQIKLLKNCNSEQKICLTGICNLFLIKSHLLQTKLCPFRLYLR